MFQLLHVQRNAALKFCAIKIEYIVTNFVQKMTARTSGINNSKDIDDECHYKSSDKGQKN